MVLCVSEMEAAREMVSFDFYIFNAEWLSVVVTTRYVHFRFINFRTRVFQFDYKQKQNNKMVFCIIL